MIGLIGEPIVGQGFLFGQVDKNGQLTGKDIAYIYPGESSGLLVAFELFCRCSWLRSLWVTDLV